MRRASLAVALALAVSPCRAEVLDSIVARVDQSALTWSEVLQETELQRLAGEADRGADAKSVVDALVRRRLLVEEARRMRLEVSASETAAAVQALAASAGGEKVLWQRLGQLGLTEAAVFRRAEEILLMRRYVSLREEMAYVPESEVRSYYRQQADALVGRPLDELHDEIRALLAQRKHRQELDQWLERQMAEGRVRWEELPAR